MPTKTEAANEVRKVLQAVKDQFRQPGGAKVNEATTRALFLNPLLRALGYSSIDDLLFEYFLPDGKRFLDYRLVVGGVPKVSVEAKALAVPLSNDDAAQVISYASILGDEWAVVTNAREWRLYNSFAKADLSGKLVLSTSLIGWETDEQFDAVFEQLWLISQEAFESSGGPTSWLTAKRLDVEVLSMLTDPASPTLKSLRKQLESHDIAVTPQQLASWLKGRLDPSAAGPPSTAAAI